MFLSIINSLNLYKKLFYNYIKYAYILNENENTWLIYIVESKVILGI